MKAGGFLHAIVKVASEKCFCQQAHMLGGLCIMKGVRSGDRENTDRETVHFLK